jgi:hypothetical protein
MMMTKTTAATTTLVIFIVVVIVITVVSFGRTYYGSTDFAYMKFVEHNLKISSHYYHVCSC